MSLARRRSAAPVPLGRRFVRSWAIVGEKPGQSATSPLASRDPPVARHRGRALHAGLVTTNHATRLRVRSGSTRAKQALTAKQIEALVAALPCRYQALALVLAYGDLRPAEALGMRRRHLDDPGRLLVEGGLTETRGKLIEPRRPRLTGCGSFPCRRRSPASSRSTWRSMSRAIPSPASSRRSAAPACSPIQLPVRVLRSPRRFQVAEVGHPLHAPPHRRQPPRSRACR